MVLKTTAIYPLIGETFFPVTPFVFKQFITIEELLYGRVGVILFLTLGDGLKEISSDVCIASASFEVLQFVVSGITIYIDIGAGC